MTLVNVIKFDYFQILFLFKVYNNYYKVRLKLKIDKKLL